MRLLDEGESFVVTRTGVPVAELTPMRRLRFVPVESITHLFQGAPSVDGESFRRDLDAYTDQRTEPVANLRVELAAVAASVNLLIYMRNPQDFASIDGLVEIIVI